MSRPDVERVTVQAGGEPTKRLACWVAATPDSPHRCGSPDWAALMIRYVL